MGVFWSFFWYRNMPAWSHPLCFFCCCVHLQLSVHDIPGKRPFLVDMSTVTGPPQITTIALSQDLLFVATFSKISWSFEQTLWNSDVTSLLFAKERHHLVTKDSWVTCYFNESLDEKREALTTIIELCGGYGANNPPKKGKVLYWPVNNPQRKGFGLTC